MTFTFVKPVEKPKLHLRLNLQTFSDSTHPFAAEPVEQVAHPLAAEESTSKFAQYTDVPNPLYSQAEVQTDELQGQPQGQEGSVETVEGQEQQEGQSAAQQQIEKLNFGGREVEVTDPVFHDLHKDYSELTKTYQTTNQEKAQLAQEKEQLQQQLDALQQAQSQSQQGQAESNIISPERRTQINEEYMERMYEDKMAADEWFENLPEVQAEKQEKLNAMIEAKANELLAPITQEREQLKQQQEFHQQMESMRSTHTDFESMVPEIQKLIDEAPHLADLPNALETMYYMAKGRTSQSAPTPETLLSDPNFQQQALSNPELQKQFLQQYQDKMKQQNQSLPNMMGRNAGTQTPMTAGNAAPRSLKEASAAAAAYFQQG